MKTLHTVAFAIALGLTSLSAQAYVQSESAAGNTRAPVQLNVKVSAQEQLAGVERALYSEHYSEVSLEDKSKVSAAINRIRTRLGNHDSVEQTTPQAQTDILNDQAVVNTILSRAHADSRMVCRRERATGSNRPERVCLTVAQRRKMQEDSKEGLRRFQHTNR
ncbi:MAG: hypothetical protein QHC77_13270 [Stenotrophomonas sp.]|jgi:hypothetical protein|uniref:hypothetical protein n=1 Tax=Stenotrophomonas TaxID=40323 RepID=UPI0029AF21C1|nr:hypothetical protein [Stenotrophomonas sp.]MDX3932897.1 hypothetical protein [Stenotrophomonas sp.]